MVRGVISRRRFVLGALATPALVGLAHAAPRPGQLRAGRPRHPHLGGPLPALYRYGEIKLGRARPIRRAAGSYAITCQHQVELAPTTAGAPWPDHGHEAWELTLAAALTAVITRR